MHEEMKISQSTCFGSHENTQIGIQNNYGLTYTQAIEMAFSVFRAYYPQLKQEVFDELYRLVEEKLNDVPKQNIAAPTPRIAVPALQNASITEEADIRVLYANLLANSMNSIVKKGVHPAYVEIIKQLSPDEAKILNYISAKRIIPTITLRRENEKGEGTEIVKNFSNIGELSACDQPFEINRYFDNLIRLGLLEVSNFSSLTNKQFYEVLKEHTYIKKYLEGDIFKQTEYNTPRFIEGYMSLTDFGIGFCEICL